MATSMLNIGITGLAAAQSGLLTTGHNISNASTPGFSRQAIVQSTNVPQLTGSGFFGAGTNVSTVKRIYSQFLANQTAVAQTRVAELQVYSAEIGQIDNILADPASGLSPALQQFFRSVQETAANPASIPARQSMISGAQALLSRFQGLNERIDEIRDGVNSQLASTVETINSLAQQVAELNQRIIISRASASGQPPNDLLDQRDQLLADLNRQIRVSTTVDADDTINVFIGNGQPLVVGIQAARLQAVQDALDPTRLTVAMQLPTGGTLQLVESMLTGGALGGLLGFRNSTLDSAQNALGRLAIGFAQTFNDRHRLGQDLTGALGGDFFQVPGGRVFQSSSNTGTGAMAMAITDPSQLSASDYRVTVVAGGNFQVTRLQDGATFPAGALPQTLDGVQFSLVSGAPAVGDSFLVQPTRTGARDIALAISDPRAIAAALPVRTAASVANVGTARISAGEVSSVAALPLGTVSLAYAGGSLTGFPAGATVTVNDGGVITTYPGVTPATPVAYASGATVSFSGVSVVLSGAPADGDAFTIADNLNGVADNRNALALGLLQTATTQLGGSASYQSAYSQLVSEVGNKSREIEVTLRAQENLEKQARDAQQSLSGVSLDEEAANLLRYQQAYQASGQLIAIAGRLFDELISLGRR